MVSSTTLREVGGAGRCWSSLLGVLLWVVVLPSSSEWCGCKERKKHLHTFWWRRRPAIVDAWARVVIVRGVVTDA